MMSDRILLSAYWAARRESAEECAGRLAHFLEDLREIDNLFSAWYVKSRSRKDATSHPIVVERSHLVALFAAGINRRDDDKSPITELGFNLGIWTGRVGGVSASLRVTCGSFSKHVDNVCVLDVAEGHSLSSDGVAQIVDAAVRAWDPDGVDVNLKRMYSRSA